MKSSDANKGYTLIEIVASLAIVAIIAVFAVPAMNKYFIQGKVADAMMAATPLQTKVIKEIARNESVTDSGLGITVPTNLGSYVSSASVSDDGVISITLDTNAASVQFTLSPSFNSSSEQVTWACAVTNSDFNDYVPSDCRI